MTTWKEVERPARKADYRDKFLRLSCPPPEDGQQRDPGRPLLPIQAGAVLRISPAGLLHGAGVRHVGSRPCDR